MKRRDLLKGLVPAAVVGMTSGVGGAMVLVEPKVEAVPICNVPSTTPGGDLPVEYLRRLLLDMKFEIFERLLAGVCAIAVNRVQNNHRFIAAHFDSYKIDYNRQVALCPSVLYSTVVSKSIMLMAADVARFTDHELGQVVRYLLRKKMWQMVNVFDNDSTDFIDYSHVLDELATKATTNHE